MSKKRVAILWYGDPGLRPTSTFAGTRLGAIAQALTDVGLDVEPCIYADSAADEVRIQLSAVDGVLVWVNPTEQDFSRRYLDVLLTEVEKTGVFVSARPDTINRIGTKAVLFDTRTMDWGGDIQQYLSLADLAERFPSVLATGTRVLKQHRGNGGNGVFKVMASGTGTLHVQHAARGSIGTEMTLAQFHNLMAGYLESGGRIIDQPFQPRLADGMIRCYLVAGTVVGFGEQLVNALYPETSGPVAPGPRRYYPPSRSDFQRLRQQLERDWLDRMCALVNLEKQHLPVIWDADFLYGPRDRAGSDSYVLCEINTSSVFPMPDEALLPLALETRRRLDHR